MGGAQRARTLAITNEAGSALARAATLALVTEAGHEQALPATKSHTTQLAAVAVLGAALAAEHDGGRDLDLLEQVPAAVTDVLAQDGGALDRLVEALAPVRSIVVAGRGYHSATAREVALKLQETCELPAVGMSWADLLHGPLALLGADAPALLVAPPFGPVLAGTVTVARRLGERAPVYGIGGDGAFRAACELVVPASDLPEHLAPIAAVVPGQQLAERLARRLGLDPDQPRGLRKVTQTDQP